MKHLNVVSRANEVQPAVIESELLAAVNSLKKDPKVRRIS